MAIVAGVDFGTLSVRVSLVDSDRGLLASAVREYPLHRKREDPEYAMQSHDDHMHALAAATREAVRKAGISADRVQAIALDTTGSSVIPVGKNMQPLAEYYLWCDHRAKGEAAEISEAARREGLEAIQWCGGVYSSEWGFSKLLHWLRHNPAARSDFASAFEHCDMVAATLSGITDPKKVKRSICAMGHKWLWNRQLGGLPPESFLVKVDPLLRGIRDKLDGEYATSDQIAGTLSRFWAEELGLKAGIPIPVGAFDAHWDAIGAGCRTDDMVNVVGTSTCIIGITPSANLVPGVCGVVQGSVHPQRTGIEAGLSAVGDIFSAIATRAGTDVKTLSAGLENYRAGQTGLLRMTWDNGDRTVLVNPNLRGVTCRPEQDAMRGDDRHASDRRPGDRQHVQDEGIVAAALGRHVGGEALIGVGERVAFRVRIAPPFVQAERWIGDYHIEAHQVIAFDQRRRVECVAPVDTRAILLVQEHVQSRQGTGAAVRTLGRRVGSFHPALPRRHAAATIPTHRPDRKYDRRIEDSPAWRRPRTPYAA